MKKFKQFMLAALVVGFGYPVSAWAFNDLTQGQQQGQIGINKQGQAQGQAQGQGQQQGQGQAQGQIGINKSTNTNNNNANSRSKSKGIGVGVGLSKSSNKGNTNNINIEGDDIDPPAYAPNTAVFNPTVPCKVPLSASGGFLGLVSLGGAGALTDENCVWIEKAKACTHGMKAFPEMKETCKEMWRLAMMSEDDRDAAIAAKNAPPAEPTAQFYSDPATGKIVKLELGEKMPADRVALVPLDSAPDNVVWNNDKHTIALHTDSE